ncbi:MAG: hypothetical protein RMY28_009290 [Nostoc sp. ChiSLP01]|nr:hypothetical protein [Nostoc sp. CmiSLP01]MDZ8285249.1 hypothetical protein [Nostoc sp. ChiSLP01]
MITNAIKLPSTWIPPKYHPGKQVKQGEIIGMEYHPPGTKRARELGKGWFYTVMIDELEDDVEIIKESAIELPSGEDLLSEIDSLDSLAQTCHSKIASLEEQLKEIKQLTANAS